MKLICYVLIFLLMSCSKQEPESLKSTHHREDITRNTDCDDVVFISEPLEKENLKNLLSCMGWNKQYPELSKTIDKFDEEKFNFISSPFNKTFFENRTKRTTYFELFQVLNQDSGEGFSSLDDYITELLPPWSELARKYFKYAKEENRLEFLKKASLDKKTVKNEIEVYTEVQKYFLLNKEFSKELKKALNDPKLILKISKVLAGISDLDTDTRSVVAKVFWAKDGLVSRSTMIKTNSFYNTSSFINQNYQMIKSIGSKIYRSQNKEINCAVSSPRKYQVLMHEYLEGEVKLFATTETSEWSQHLANIAQRVHLTELICSNDTITDIKPDALNAVATIEKLCQTAGQCEMFQSILKTLGPESINKLYQFLESDSFTDFNDFLSYLNKSHKNLLLSLDKIINQLPKDFLTKTAKSYLRDNEQQSLSFLLIEIINSFKDEEVIKGAQLLGRFVDNEKYVKHVNPFFLEMFYQFPSLSIDLLDKFKENPIRFYESVLHFLDFVNNETLTEFINFLSMDSLLKMYKQFAGPGLGKKIILGWLESQSDPIIEEKQIKLDHKYSKCINGLKSNYVSLANYAEAYPADCMKSAYGFIHQLSVNMHTASKDLDFVYLNDYYRPELLAQLVSLTKEYNKNIQTSGLLNNVNLEKINTNTTLFEFGLFLDQMFIKNNFKFWSSQLKSKDTVKVIKSIPNILDSKTSYQKIPEMNTCKSRNKDIGAKTCMSIQELKEWLTEFKKITLRKNENGLSVLSELLDMFYDGISVPVNKPIKKLPTDLKEFIAFFHILSDASTAEDIIFKYGDREKIVFLSIIEQIEVLLREISFQNNYFGAYFKNDIANNENYLKTVKLNRGLFNNGGSWMLKLLGYIRDEDDNRVENASVTFESLLKLDNKFELGRETYQFGNLTHALVSALVESSSKESKSLSIRHRPNQKLVENHNGVFLTHLAKIGGLSYIGEFFHSRVPDLAKTFEDESFNQLNKNFFKKVPKETLLRSFSNLVNHIDNDNLIFNLNSIIQEKNPEAISLIEQSMMNLVKIVIKSDLTKREMDGLYLYLDSIINTLSSKKFNLKNLKPFIVTLNKITRDLAFNTNKANRLLKLIAGTKAPKNLNFLIKILESFENENELNKFLTVVLSGIDYNALAQWFNHLSKSKYLIKPNDKYFSTLFTIKGYRFGNSSNAKLNYFLNDLSKYIEIK